MIERGARARIFALGALLLLWLSGVGLMSSRAAPIDSCLRREWSIPIADPSVQFRIGSAGGLYRFDYRIGYMQLSRLSPESGQLLWEFPLDAAPNPLAFHEETGSTYVSLWDGRMLAVSSAGELLWQFEPASENCRNHPPQPDAREAELFCVNGRILYGLSSAGELCWARDTSADLRYTNGSGLLKLLGRRAFVLNDRNMTLAWPDGAVEDLTFRNMDEADPRPPLLQGSQLQLIGKLAGERLLIGNGTELQVLGNTVEAAFSPKDLNSQPGGEGDGVYPGGEQILVVTGETHLRGYATSGKQLWEYELTEGSITNVVSCDGCFILQTKNPDNAAKSLLAGSDLIVGFRQLLRGPQGRPVRAAHYSFADSGTELLVIRDGRLMGQLHYGPIGGMGLQLLTTEDRLLLVREKRIDCYRLELP